MFARGHAPIGGALLKTRNGRIKKAIKRAFWVSPGKALSTTDLRAWAYPRGRGGYRNGDAQDEAIRQAAEKLCERVGYAKTVGNPILWRLKAEGTSEKED
jgi:hypothetical protein